MVHSKRKLRRLSFFATSLTIVGLLVAPVVNFNHTPLKNAVPVAKASSSLGYTDFIYAAYYGAYGRYPDCDSEVTPEYNALVYSASQSQSALLAECKRFVATLFETQDSYDETTGYTQTYEYEQRNSNNNTDYSHQESFVTDLYDAFLQRAPDSSGLAFWTNNTINNGRRATVVAFEVCTEFSDLVDSLYDDGGPWCPPCGGMTCDSGYHLDTGICQCVPDCLQGGDIHPICQ
jgi:hypothetical protein